VQTHPSPQPSEPGRPAHVRALWRRPGVLRGVRIGVSLTLLAVLLFGVDWPAVLAHLEQLSAAIAIVVMVAFAVQLGVSAWKWQWALRIHEQKFSLVFLTRIQVIAFFLNNFLPTSIGGDAYRIYRTIPTQPPKSRAVSAVLLERLVGVSVLLLLGLAGALWLYSSSALARAYVACAVAGAVIVVAVGALIRARSAKWQNSNWLRTRWLAPVTENVRTIARARGAWVPLIGVSLLFQATAILILYEMFVAVGAHVGLAQSALIAATAGVAAVIPVSINGLGIVEATIAGTAVAVGVSYEAGLLVAVLMRVLLIPLTLLAGLLYAFEPVHAREAQVSISR
jgi:glycosyltransferase 2 family protein